LGSNETKCKLCYAGLLRVELNYGARIAPWLLLRPNLQYIIQPGGTGDRATRSWLICTRRSSSDDGDVMAEQRASRPQPAFSGRVRSALARRLYASPVWKRLPSIGWQGIFAVGGIVPLALALALVVILMFALPESLHFLTRHRAVIGRKKIERIVAKITKRELSPDSTYSVPEMDVKTRVTSLFSGGLARNTFGIWTVYLFNWVAWFMFLSWLPTVLKATGLPAEQAPMGTVALNAVFVICAIPLSIILPKINTRLLLLVLFLFGIALCLGLANSGNNWTLVFILAGCAGLGIGGQQIVLNYMVAQAYPTALRATATGWAIALGRVGAIIGSASGGWFLEHGGPAGYYSALIVPLVIAAAGLMIIRTQPDAMEGPALAAH
jgi:AAHS family 4-hydroxybenzoate transporter-like MFS transporter